ncbi:hypothetical protein [Actinophytocola sp.]|uniref:hypothetical protein n=1 Tax=Actinophytocola sp. TaxID=1872138 RepID=UPI003899DB03
MRYVEAEKKSALSDPSLLQPAAPRFSRADVLTERMITSPFGPTIDRPHGPDAHFG